jgi:hypothetical protein
MMADPGLPTIKKLTKKMRTALSKSIIAAKLNVSGKGMFKTIIVMITAMTPSQNVSSLLFENFIIL